MLTAICSATNGKDADGCGNDVLSIVLVDSFSSISVGSEKLQPTGVYEFPEYLKINAIPSLGFISIHVFGELPPTTEKV